ncbi:MAG TPA: hypothetical protein VES88_10145 [Gemmatimonadaceae bacterium]|nr:hypothetical protein [Gemmatimonadaceae bacterium]
MNSEDIGRIARGAEYVWATDTIPESSAFGRFDHFFVRGLVRPGGASVGRHRVPRSMSDHSPIWIKLHLPQIR